MIFTFRITESHNALFLLLMVSKINVSFVYNLELYVILLQLCSVIESDAGGVGVLRVNVAESVHPFCVNVTL